MTVCAGREREREREEGGGVQWCNDMKREGGGGPLSDVEAQFATNIDGDVKIIP